MVTNDMQTIDSFIGRRIRQYRWVLGISQDDLGRHLGVTPDQIKTYETGGTRVSAAELFLIAQAMDIPVSAFFKGMGAEPDAGTRDPHKVLSAREAHLLGDFRRMSDRQQDAVLSMARSMAEQARPAADAAQLSVVWREEAKEG